MGDLLKLHARRPGPENCTFHHRLNDQCKIAVIGMHGTESTQWFTFPTAVITSYSILKPNTKNSSAAPYCVYCLDICAAHVAISLYHAGLLRLQEAGDAGKSTSDGAAHPMSADKIVMAAKAPAAPPNTYIECKASEHDDLA